ncbi:unnamed protein product [Pylaiella littoralis]
MGLIAQVTDAMILFITIIVSVMVLCAVKIAFSSATKTRQLINTHLTPAFPCDGILFILARDGLLYAVPERTAVIKTDRVHEVHCGRIVRSHDNHGHFAYFEDDVDQRQGLRIANDGWSVSSDASQHSTAPLSDTGSDPFPSLQSPLLDS